MLVFIPQNPGLPSNLPVLGGKTSAFDSLGDWTWTGWLTTDTASLLCQVHLYLVLLLFTGILWTRWTCSYTFPILQRPEASVQDVTMKTEVESQPNIFSKLLFRWDIEHTCFLFFQAAFPRPTMLNPESVLPSPFSHYEDNCKPNSVCVKRRHLCKLTNSRPNLDAAEALAQSLQYLSI